MKGNHGGDTPDEASSFIFGYTKRGFADEIRDPRYAKIMGNEKRILT